MVKIPDNKEMMQAGVHFGHKTAKWHPAMKQYVYGVKSGVHIFDLEKTRETIEKALKIVEDTVARGGEVLFLGTKKQARKIVREYAEKAECPYVTEGWIGGTLTNWAEIRKLVRKMEDIEKKESDPDYELKYTKKERQLFTEDKDRLNKKVGGIRTMKNVPQLIYIAGVKDEKTAVKEAKVRNVKTVGIVDTNTNPANVTQPIVANDDATKSIELVTSLVAEAVKEGRKKQVEKKVADEKKKDPVQKIKK